MQYGDGSMYGNAHQHQQGAEHLERRALYSRPHGFLPPPPQDDYNRWLGEGVQHQQNQQYFARMDMCPSADMRNVLPTTNRYNALWVFVDLETTNLDPTVSNFGILEIAAGVVDDSMAIIDTFHVVVHQPRHIINGSSRWCKQHFGSRLDGGNDLFSQCEASTISEAEAGNMLHAFILKHAKERCPETNTSENMRRKYFQAAEFVPVEQAVEEAVLPPPTVDMDAEAEFVPLNMVGIKDKEENKKTEYYKVMLAGKG
jgi:oligoribonuclease (3'-5' exoribonuclease)